MVLVSDKGQKYQIKEVSENFEKYGNNLLKTKREKL
jgi:hypothetical protein